MKVRTTLAALVLVIASVPLFAQNTTGTWSTSVAPSSGQLTFTPAGPAANGKGLNCKRAVIPIIFEATTSGSTSSGLVLTSNTGDTDTTNDFSTLTFTPSSPMTVSQLTNLTAVYSVTAGNCGGGSLRWSVTTSAGNVFVYYGATPNFTDCTGTNSQSGVNLLSTNDLRVDTTQVGGTFYDMWANFVAANPNLTITSISLVADGGWSQTGGLQSFTVQSATVNDNTFVASGETSCNLPEATLTITGPNTNITQTLQGTSSDDDEEDDDCAYHYNLRNPGPGTYTATLTVNGQTYTETFTISCKK